MEQAMLTVEGLSKVYRGTAGGVEAVRAVNDVSFVVQPGEFLTLLGPSGCGKTTTLRSIAGLETPDEGRIEVAGRTMFDASTRTVVPPNARPLGMVFQSYAVWPHMSVRRNVAFPLEALPRKERPTRSAIATEVERVLELVDLSAMIDRPATKLSGGQQQRLALARALIRRPALLLLDEPLSNLDAKLRDSLRFELSRLQRETGQTTVYVTHDQGEALALSTRVVVMEHGRIAQIGTPREIYDEPANRFTAEFVGTANFFDGKVAGVEHDRVVCESPFGMLAVASPSHPVAVGDAVALAIRPEAIEVLDPSRTAGAEGAVEGTIVGTAFQGDATDVICGVGSHQLLVRVHGGRSFTIGDAVTVQFAAGRTRIVRVDDTVVAGPAPELATGS